MDGESKIYLGEGVPLNSTGAANIFLNTGKSPKVSTDGTVIHLKTEKPSDLGVHINTTFSIASSKKIKLLFVLNFLLIVICIVISCSMAYYYWNEMVSMRRQLDTMKDHLFVQNLSHEKVVQSALVARSAGDREPRMDSFDNRLPQNTKTFYVKDLGDNNMLLVDMKKKYESDALNQQKLTVLQRDLLVAQFNGAEYELHMKEKESNSVVGPWVRDEEVSSKNSDDFVELNKNHVTIKEGGLYLIYAQIVYLSQAPNYFSVWATQNAKDPRLLSTCATGDILTSRPLSKSQLSCSVQTVARLYVKDTINISQREPNRTLWLRPGFSYFGLIKLSS